MTAEGYIPAASGTINPPSDLQPNDVVIVQFRDGLYSKARKVDSLRWEHVGNCDDVIAYHKL